MGRTLESLLTPLVYQEFIRIRTEAEQADIGFDESETLYHVVTSQNEQWESLPEANASTSSMVDRLHFLGLQARHAAACAKDFEVLLTIEPLAFVVLHYIECVRSVPTEEFPSSHFPGVSVGNPSKLDAKTNHTVHFVRESMASLALTELKFLCATSPQHNPPARERAFYYHACSHDSARSILGKIVPKARHSSDFTAGPAFYLHPSYTRAEWWAKHLYKSAAAVVVFCFSRSELYAECKVTEADASECELVTLDEETMERWRTLVKGCRSNGYEGLDAGFTYGPISKPVHPTLLSDTDDSTALCQYQFAAIRSKHWPHVHTKLRGVIFFAGS